MSSVGLAFEAFIRDPFPVEESLPLARQILRTLETTTFGPLSPSLDQTRAILAAERHEGYERNFEAIWMNVDRFTRGSDWWILKVDQLHSATLPWAVVGVHVPIGHNREDFTRNWEILLQGAARLLPLLRPCFAAASGTSGLAYELKTLRPTEPPPFLAPWTYFAEAVASVDWRKQLETIPGARLTPTPDGVVFEVPDFLERPRRDFERAVKALPRTPHLKWCPPTPPAESS